MSKYTGKDIQTVSRSCPILFDEKLRINLPPSFFGLVLSLFLIRLDVVRLVSFSFSLASFSNLELLVLGSYRSSRVLWRALFSNFSFLWARTCGEDMITVGDLDRRRLIVGRRSSCCSPAPWLLGGCRVNANLTGAGRMELSDEEWRLRFTRSSL
jgi:hypothetical protein